MLNYLRVNTNIQKDTKLFRVNMASQSHNKLLYDSQYVASTS